MMQNSACIAGADRLHIVALTGETEMDLQTVFDNMMTAAQKERLANSPQLTLGEIISKCEVIAAKGYKCHDGGDPTVTFDFEHASPTTLDSWRGIYAELAIGFKFEGNQMPMTHFIEMMKAAVGATFEGYKGGDYVMSRHTPVWVANYGNSGNTAIVGVRDLGYSVIIETAYQET